MRVGCTACGRESASFEAAQRHHVGSHSPVRRAVGGTINGRFVKQWPKESDSYYQEGIPWGEWEPKEGDLTPQITLNQGLKRGGNRPS